MVNARKNSGDMENHRVLSKESGCQKNRFHFLGIRISDVLAI